MEVSKINLRNENQKFPAGNIADATHSRIRVRTVVKKVKAILLLSLLALLKSVKITETS